MRAIVIGLAFVVFVNIAGPHSLWVLQSSNLASGYLPLGLFFPFFLLMVLNGRLRGRLRRFALRRDEAIVVLVMAWIGASIPTWGVTGYLISVIAAPHYYATAENGWAELLHPHLPEWLVPTDARALAGLFNGIQPGDTIPWGVWAAALMPWMGLMAALFAASYAVVAILRKQWVERERLTYPLALVPLELIESSTEGAAGFTRQKSFRYGFALAMGILLWNAISYAHPFVPVIPIAGQWVTLVRDFPPVNTMISFPVVGFTFLIPSEVSFSIWFFHLLSITQVGIFNRTGFTIGSGDIYASSHATQAWMGFGSMLFLVGWGLWMARAHLKEVWQGALRGDDSPGEMLSYRSSLVVLGLSLVYIVLWLWQSGMDAHMIAPFLFAVFVLYIGVTRIVAEGGLIYVRGPMVAQTFATYSLGSLSMSRDGMAAMGLTYSWQHELKGFFMATAAHAARLVQGSGISRGRLAFSIALSTGVSLVVSIWYILVLCYQEGAYNFGWWIFRRGATIPYDTMLTKMAAPFGPDWKRLGFLAIGFAAMGILTALRYRFSRWPLNPIGLPVASTFASRMFFNSFFLGWLARAAVNRTGGISLYARSRPFFIGVILGSFTAMGLLVIVDLIWFPGEGHRLYGI